MEMVSEAESYARKAYELYRHIDDMVAVNFACVLISQKRYTKAIEILEVEKNKDSINYLVYNNLGYSYFLTSQHYFALENYNISIQLEENNPLAYCNRGNLKYIIFNDVTGICDLKKAEKYEDFEASLILRNIVKETSSLN